MNIPKLPRLCSHLGLASCLSLGALRAAPTSVYTENFDVFTGPATSLADTANANPATPEILVSDDSPLGADPGTGVQLVNWLASSGAQSLLVRSGSEAVVQLHRPLSGSKYQIDFKLHVVKGSGDRNFYVIVRAMGSDTNGEDFLAYRSDRAAGGKIVYYDGIGDALWRETGASHVEQQWQHHRIVVDMRAQTFDLFIDNMTTPVVQGGDLSRPGAAVPTAIIIRNEGNSADDGYFAIDDITVTAEEARPLNTTFTEGFEGYSAVGAGSAEDADPQGAWITTEVDGVDAGKLLAPHKVQVVDSSVVPPHSGQKSLKLEGGQRAGVSFAWGTAPQSDVQVTWWARVPASVQGTQANYLRMSLYGVEGDRADQGDAALLGYGSRDARVGDATSLTIYTTAWQDTTIDYTPDAWEEYRLITHVEQGTYSIIKNPSSENPITVADRAPFIGATQKWGPMFMIAWSSSNGNLHPPVYIDDIKVESVTTSVEPLSDPYIPVIEGDRFKHVSSLQFSGPLGDVAVDPRDNSTIFFAMDGTPGGIYRATKVSPGTWEIDPQPIVSNLDRPSGLVVDSQGTLWWTHDYTQRLIRLKAPYAINTPEVVIESFAAPETDDDPIDLVIAPSSFAGAPNFIVVADRGTDGDANNSLHLVDPANIQLNQVGYNNFLVQPSNSTIGSANLNAITPVPQTGEVAVINGDAFIYLVNGAGEVRSILPNIYADPFVTINPIAIAADPTTGRIWLADNVFKEVWSISTAATPEAERKELSFTLKEGTRPDSNIIFHEPGLSFSNDGSILVVTDGSTINGGGRLLIYHNEEAQTQINITRVARTAQGFELEWSAGGTGSYKVLRATSLGSQTVWQDASPVLTQARFTDANPPAGSAFYRVVAVSP